VEDEETIGYFVLKPAYLAMRIFSISVTKPNIGAGSTALAWIEDYVLNNCPQKAVMLEVREDNVEAIAFYQKNGYEAFAKEYKFYWDGMDAVKMKKELQLAK
jgi:RimJ/RimL family protein N-acetyltransferase